MRLVLLIAIIVSTSVPAFSQSEINGTVFDIKTGEPLPSATILIQDTFRGTITNLEGDFFLRVDDLPVSILVRYIGYDSELIHLNNVSQTPLKIGLTPAISELDEIVVTARDPGLSIMERVIARKQLWRVGLDNYKVNSYTRQSLGTDTSIVSITESSSVAYWHNLHGHREIQLSARQTMNLSEDENLSGVRYLPNFYDDDIEIAGYNVIGITNPNALRYYDFKLINTSYMDGKPVYIIEVIPKRKLQPLFEGTVFILGREYAMLEVDLKPNSVVTFPPPIQDFNMSYKQQFNNYNSQYWLPVDMRIEGRIQIGMVGLRFPAMNFKQVSRLSDYVVNSSIPDSIFDNQNWFTRADSTALRDEIQIIQQIPLTAEERDAYESIDSTKTIEDAFKPEGFLARMIDSDEENAGNSRLSYLNKIVPNGLSPNARYNRVEGFHLGLRYEQWFEKLKFNFNSFGGYSFNSDQWDYGLILNKRLIHLSNSSINAVAGYENISESMFSSKLYNRGMNSISAVIGGDDYFDYYRVEKIYSSIIVNNLIPKLNLTIGVNRERHQNFENLEMNNFSLLRRQANLRTNFEIEQGILQSLSLEIGYNISPKNFGFAGQRQLKAFVEISDDQIGSDYNFVKYEFSLDWNFDTFYQRRLFSNKFDVHVSAGTSTGNLPFQRYGSIDGSLSNFTPFGTLRSRRNIPYAGDKYWLFLAEHNFRTIPFELIGLNALVDRGWGIILYGGAGQTFSDRNDIPGFYLTEGVHTELGISLNSVFGIMRIDFTKRIDTTGSFIGISLPRYF